MTRYRYLKGNVTAEKLLEGIETRVLTYFKRQNSRTWDHVDYTSLPKFLHDNEFLLSGHRPELNSVTECLKTVFMVHSETGNIWTHALGAATCLFLSVYYLNYIAQDWQHGLTFAVFFMGAILCLGISAVYHLFICHSEPVCKFLAKCSHLTKARFTRLATCRMDYCGIIILNIASYVPWLHFAFYQDWAVQAIYMLLITLFGACGIAVVIRDEFREPQFRHMRFGLFLCIGLTGFIPALHCLLFTDFLRVVGFPFWLVVTGLLYFIGGLTYSTRFPESIWPGKFDIWCQSHQIMHVCVIGGVLSCYQGAAELAAMRLNSC